MNSARFVDRFLGIFDLLKKRMNGQRLTAGELDRSEVDGESGGFMFEGTTDSVCFGNDAMEQSALWEEDFFANRSGRDKDSLDGLVLFGFVRREGVEEPDYQTGTGGNSLDRPKTSAGKVELAFVRKHDAHFRAVSRPQAGLVGIVGASDNSAAVGKKLHVPFTVSLRVVNRSHVLSEESGEGGGFCLAG